MQHCYILCCVFGEAVVAQEEAIWRPAGAAAGIEFHATMLTLVQITQVARCATQPAACPVAGGSWGTQAERVTLPAL